MHHDDLIDALAELQHDLGKHLARPVAWLPPEASAAEVRAAARRALFETQKGPAGVRSAAALWAAFEAEAGAAAAGLAAWPAAVAAVARALAWAPALDQPAPLEPAPPLDRARLEADLTAVGVALRALVMEASGDG